MVLNDPHHSTEKRFWGMKEIRDVHGVCPQSAALLSCDSLLINLATRLAEKIVFEKPYWRGKKCGELIWCFVPLHFGSFFSPNLMLRASHCGHTVYFYTHPNAFPIFVAHHLYHMRVTPLPQ